MTRTALLTVTLLLVMSPLLAADSPCCDLLIPQAVEIGGYYDLCICAPPDAMVFIMMSHRLADVPLQLPCGLIELQLPPDWIFPMWGPPQAEFCFPKHRVPCDPDLVGIVGFFQLAAVLPTGECCVSNVATMRVIDGPCNPPR